MAIKIYFKSPKVIEGILIQITYRRKRKKLLTSLRVIEGEIRKLQNSLKKECLRWHFIVATSIKKPLSIIFFVR